MSVMVLEKTRIGPPSGSVADTTVPLTFLDVFWLPMQPVQRLFFYQFPDPNTSTAHFLHSILPNLKQSLSLALQLFYPLAGTISFSQECGEHVIRYLDGDSVPFMVAESGSDFHLLASNGPVDVTQSHPLIPELPTFDLNLISLKVTIFPNAGICIGISVHHVAADGSSSTHFMKSWASICKTGHVSSISSLPSYNRAVIQDPRGLKRIFLDQNRVYLKSEVVNSLGVTDQTDSVRATLVLTRADIERLKQRVAAANRRIKGEESFHCSAFVVICAHVWVCMVAARGEDPNKLSSFGFSVDCRARLGYPISETYFGNCVMLFVAQAKVGELDGVNGFVAGVESIGSVIGGLKVEVLNGAETMIPRAAIDL